MESNVRDIPDPVGIADATTLPAHWYADNDHHHLEMQAIFGQGWVGAGVIDDMPVPGAWTARSVAGTPVLLVVDRAGELRAFLNVCRHRAAPLCEPGDHTAGPMIRCPYHSWLYRLDGTLARAGGVGHPSEFDLSDYSLFPVGVHVWRRTIWINLGAVDAPFDLGPLANAIDSFPLEAFELIASETDDRLFNWKVLLENYSENYHTPFVHPEIDTSSTEDYPMVSAGAVLYAWDRPLRPSADDPSGVIRATLLPGEPGWDLLATANPTRPYGVGSYLTIWPNMMVNVFPDALLVMWMQPLGPTTTRVERRLYVAAAVSGDQRDAIAASHRQVHMQDIDICQRVQRSHTAGVNANGRLATVEERGVYFVHAQLRAALDHAGRF